MFLALAFLAGVGSGAYHPLGASNAAAVTDKRYVNTAMSLYTVGGTTGYALGPLVAVALLAVFGPRGTAALLVPGIVVAALLLPQMGRVERARGARPAVAGEARVLAPGAWRALARVIAVVMLRSWVFLAVIQFVPVWYDDLGYSAGFYGALVTAIILAGAVGTLLGGGLADRFGQGRLLFVGFPGEYALLTGALFGLACDASLSVTLVAAQRLLPGQAGVASGVILGLGFITGGIGVPVTGILADAVGVQTALMLVGALCLVAAALATTVPWDKRPAFDAAPGPRPMATSGE
jgi:FSR family fosmidomycin resistance protein-like MFS transporter